jgi:hypothetical protein
MPSIAGMDPSQMVGVSFFGLFVVGMAMWAGAMLAGIRDVTTGRIVMASLVASLTTYASLLAGQALRGLAGAAAVLGGSVLVVHLMRVIFRTTTGKALVAYFANVLIQMITAGLMARMIGVVK